MQDRLGICQWFHYEDRKSVRLAVELLHELGIRHLRTGISWADWHRPHGREWYRWQMRQLRDFDILLSIWHTPPSLAENGLTSGPPRRLTDFAGFVWTVIQEYGETFSHLELWNEPNNRYKWAFPTCDPQWEKFGKMIRMGARTAKEEGVPTVLGGMIPVDPAWLGLMKTYGALEFIDIVAIHGFPMMWWPDRPNWEWYHHWRGWEEKVCKIIPSAEGRPIWITEAGLASWNLEEACEDRLERQIEMLDQAAAAPAERIYWYSLIDLDPSRAAIEGFHVDENEYHMGLVRHDGTRKPAWNRMRELLRGG